MQKDPPWLMLDHIVAKKRLRVVRQQGVIQIKKGDAH
jgi:hypothetical protein